MESGRVPKKGPGKHWKRLESGRVPERWNSGENRRRVRVSTRKVGSGRVSEKGPGELERWDPGEYRKGGIRASTGRRNGEEVESGRVPENHQTKRE